MASRLEHPVVARISLTGYASKELEAHARPHELDFSQRPQPRRILAPQVRSFSRRPAPISETFTGGITAKVSDAAVGLQPRRPLKIPGPRRLAPHSRSSQVQQSLPQGQSRTRLLRYFFPTNPCRHADKAKISNAKPSLTCCVNRNVLSQKSTLHLDVSQKQTAGRRDGRPAGCVAFSLYCSGCLGLCGTWSGGCGCAATGVTVAAPVLLAANSEGLYFGALMYP